VLLNHFFFLDCLIILFLFINHHTLHQLLVVHLLGKVAVCWHYMPKLDFPLLINSATILVVALS